MKTIGFFLVLGCVLQASVEAQTTTQTAPPNTNTVPASITPSVIGRSANSRMWARITSQTNAAGQVSLVTNKAYTELASGLCYVKDGQWADAVEEIDIVANGASATKAGHTVTFAGNANTAGGAVHLVTPDGKVFDSTVYGLSYWDSANGSNALLAPLQDCQGTVVGNNIVIYTNAFKGLAGDIEYIFTKAGLEQNIILREQPPAPDSIGLNPQTTRLQVYTEFFSPPTPQKTTRLMNGVEEDVKLNFGVMGIGPGKAFYTQGQGQQSPLGSDNVAKQWTQINYRDFLIEEVKYQAISNVVLNLPLHASVATPAGNAIKRTAALFPLLPRNMGSAAKPVAMKKVASLPRQPGLIIDYNTVSGVTTNFVFQSDATYYVSGYCEFSASVTFEGGTVVKFGSSSSAKIDNEGTATGVFLGSEYRPVVFTSWSDNSLGDTISGSSGSPSQGTGTYYYEDGGVSIYFVTMTNLRVSYAGVAYSDTYDYAHLFRDCQFVNCGTNMYLGYSGWKSSNFCQNVLSANCSAFAACIGEGTTEFDIENVTVDSCSAFVVTASGYGPYGGGITNSILTACDSSISDFTQVNTTVASSGSGIYHPSVGNGNYYLASGSTNQNAGTTNINPALLADLQTKTTYPPTVYSNATISTATVLGIYATRESGAAPDLGYGYDPLDYVFGSTTINNNITFTPGTGVGWFNAGSGYGILMGNYMTASFQGTATAPVWWVRSNTSQEQGGTSLWTGAGAVGGLVGDDNQNNNDIGPSPIANLFFTKCSILTQGDGGGLPHFRDDYGYLIVQARNSEFHGGGCGGYIISMLFTNCLMDRMFGSQVAGWPSNQFILRNCTWRGSSLTLSPYDTPMTISIRDCAFDGTTNSASSYGVNPVNADYSYNAFTNSNWGFPIGGANDVIVTSGFGWETSWLGRYYLPSTSTLLNAGDLSAADYGLYHFTTQTNQTPQGTAMVDIGYHYVAVGTNGLPLDTNGDGIPDYLEDANGNGVVDSGEIDWQVAGDLGLQVWITHLNPA